MNLLISLLLALTLFQVSISQESPPFVPPHQGLTPVDLTDFQNDANGQDGLEFAVQMIARQGIEAKVFLSNSTWSVAQVLNVSTNGASNYTIIAQLTDQMNDLVNVSLVVSQQEDDTWKVLYYAYFYNLQHDGVLDDWGRAWEVIYRDGNPLSVKNIYHTVYDAAEFAVVPKEWVQIPYDLYKDFSSRLELILKGPRFFTLNEGIYNGSIPWVYYKDVGLLPEAYTWQDPVNGTTYYHAGFEFEPSDPSDKFTAIAYYSLYTNTKLDAITYEHYVVLLNNTETN